MMSEDEKFMAAAVREADKAAAKGEIPVGCVIVVDGKIIGRGHNLRESKNDPCAHAEVVALRKAGARTRSWRLIDATVYVSCEPCAMCAGALVLSRVKRVVFGCKDPKAGALESLFLIGRDQRLNHQFEVMGGVLEKECRARLSGFFKKARSGL